MAALMCIILGCANSELICSFTCDVSLADRIVRFQNVFKDDNKSNALVRVLKKSKELISYSTRNGTTMKYFNVIIGIKLRCFQRTKFPFIREGLSNKFINVVPKTDSFWIVQTSSVVLVPPVPCDISADTCVLPEEEPSTGRKRSITEALSSPQKSVVSPVTMKCEGALPVRCLGIKDRTGTVKVALFNTLAEASYVENSTVELSGLYQKSWEGRKQLVASRDTECQYLPETEDSIKITDADLATFSNDTDFGSSGKEQLTVSGIHDLIVYSSCSYDGCHKKKLQDRICPICSGTSSINTCRANIEVSLCSGQSLKLTLFESDLAILFGKPNLDECDELDIISSWVTLLPLSFKGFVKNERVFNIEKE